MMQWNQGAKSVSRIMAFMIGLLALAGVSFAEDEAEVWSGELALAITAQSGTTDTFSGSVDAKTERTFGADDLVRVRFSGVYGTTRKRKDEKRTSTETIQNSQAIYADWKHTFSDRFFWVTPTEVSRDSTQDLEVRAALSTGPGYRVWQGEDPAKNHFDISAGPGYRYEIYDGNTGGAVSENGDASHFGELVAAFEYKNMLFEDRIEYSHITSARIPANDVGSYFLRSEVIIGVPLTEAWSFRTSFLVEYVAQPGSDEVNNTTTRTSVGLGYKF